MTSKRTKNATEVIKEWFEHICLQCGVANKEQLWPELPKKWQKHGDILLFPDNTFRNKFWLELDSHHWQDLACRLKVKRLGLMGKTQPNGFRQPTVRLLVGSCGWAEHIDNHITYCFDVTKTMFSSGNITEKMRVASFDCSNEVVVDLYAGIGYYTLPYLIHAKASHVHACEWNPDAVTALQRGLRKNKADDRCTIHSGDNSQAEIKDIADRVNLGLLPTSRPGWIVACRALKSTGGYLHIHDCLNTKGQDKVLAEDNYCTQAIADITELLLSVKRCSGWQVKKLRMEKVKSYAPHITHIVFDLLCSPL